MDLFKEYAMALLEKKDIPSLLEDFSDRLGSRAAYRSISMERAFTGSRDLAFNERVRSFPLQELMRIFRTFPIHEDGRTCGYLIVDGEAEATSPLVTAAVLGLRLLVRREIASQQRSRLFEENTLREILSGVLTDQTDIGERLKLLRIPADAPCFCMIVRCEQELPDCGETIENLVKTFFPLTLTLTQEGQTLCAVVPQFAMGDVAIRDNLANMKNLCRRQASEAMIGVGSKASSIAALRSSYDEARRALILGRLEHKGDGLFLWKELGAVKVLGIIADSAEGRELHDTCLDRLLRYDEKYNMNLLETLAVLDESNWNMRIAAERMSFHINTIKYRYAKLCELLEADLKSPSVRFNISLSLRLHRIYYQARMMEGDPAQ